jgi:16S rRNA (cytosine967-C5)-methyltransferase
MLLPLDNIIETASGRKIKQIDPQIACVLRLAAYQLFYMKGEAGFAVVDAAVEQAKKISNTGAAGFVNAVLRKATAVGFAQVLPDRKSEPEKWLSIEQSHPDWIIRQWVSRFGMDKAALMCQYDNASPQAVIRVNTMKNSRAALLESLAAEGKPAAYGELSEYAIRLEGWAGAASGDLFEAGCYSVQDESSMLVAEVLEPKAGELILDVCSAPGGKACHAAELSEDRADIIAIDSNPARLPLVEENAKRLGLKCIRTMAADASKLHLRYQGKADAIVADVPCSGLGVLARRADARWRKDPSQAAQFAKIGADILDSAALCLKSGGRLVFSTCTVSIEENEEQVSSFLERHKDFSPIPLKRLEGLGISEPGSGTAQLLQGVHGSDGFFLALMRKS